MTWITIWDNLTAPYYFSVTSLDRNYNESVASNVVQITEPATPILALPLSNELNVRDTVDLKWLYADRATSYQLVVGTDSTFNENVLYNSSNENDTVQSIRGMEGQTKYYWKVKSRNIAGESNFSSVYSYTTGFPVTPVLIEPAHKTLDVSINPTLKWAKLPTAETYRIQLTKNSLTFNEQTIILDTTVVDTSLTLNNLDGLTIYYWRVSAKNQYGTSLWPGSFGFRTQEIVAVKDGNEIPSDYELYQNYPNPFNPTTKIKFSIPKMGNVEIKVYDILGRELVELVNEDFSAGSYSVTWDGKNDYGSQVPSGVYIYTIRSGQFISSKKMILLK